jgi:tetratricopeptide (TPR) repeat protein
MLAQTCLSLALLAAMPVWSQALPTATPGPDIPQDEYRMPIPPMVSGQAFPTSTLSETRSNYLDAGLSFQPTYYDNLLSGYGAQPISDMGYSIRPMVELDRLTPRLHQTWTYQPGFTFYQRTSARNEADQSAALDMQYRLSQHITVSGSDTFQKSSNVFNQPYSLSGEPISGAPPSSPANVIAPFANQLSNTANAEVAYQFSMNGMIGGGGTTAMFDYPGQAESSGLYNSTSRGGSASRSQMQLGWGDADHATQTLLTVIKNAPNNSMAHYELGIAYEKQGNLQQAESEWREAIRLNPNLVEAQWSLADAAMRLGDMNTLQDAATQVIRLQPRLPDGYALRALSNINRQHFAEAEQDIDKAIEIAPQSAFGYVQLGNLRFVQKQYGDAAKAYQDALDRNANSTDALRGLVGTLIAEKQVDKAVDVAKVQIGKSPSNSSFYDLPGSVLSRNKGDLSGAEAAFEKSVRLDKQNSDALIQLCQVQAARGEIDQAIATGEQSLKENSHQPNLDVLMGNLYQSKSDWKKAEDAYQKALAINSQDPVASFELARVLVSKGENLDVALSLAQIAGRGLPNSPAVVDTLGWIYYRKGVYPLAVNYLEQALKLQEKNNMPDNPDIDYHLGWAYEKAEQPALARQHFEHLLDGHPNYPAAAEIKKELTHLKS